MIRDNSVILLIWQPVPLTWQALINVNVDNHGLRRKNTELEVQNSANLQEIYDLQTDKGNDKHTIGFLLDVIKYIVFHQEPQSMHNELNDIDHCWHGRAKHQATCLREWLQKEVAPTGSPVTGVLDDLQMGYSGLNPDVLDQLRDLEGIRQGKLKQWTEFADTRRSNKRAKTD